MGWNDRMDDDGRTGFLKEVVEYGMLDAKAKGITRQVIDKGESGLSDKQCFIFQRVIEQLFDARMHALPLRHPLVGDVPCAHERRLLRAVQVTVICHDMADIGHS